MADPPPDTGSDLDAGDDTGDDTGVGPDRGSTTGTPRWVKVFGIIALVLVLLFVVAMLTGGGGGHGPGRHTPSDRSLGQPPLLSVPGSGEVDAKAPPADGRTP